ncbi:YqaE/Pmp3 family membrane protein [Sphingomonas sp. IC-56]|uniref:YqaE/Pmp3 family membrane protein n=1 Tax=Sphingomonas sp. IC-56 TaxID=2898529 RepID=UPI002ED95B0E
MSGATPGRIAAAVLLPPLGVYLARGAGRDFAIACGLTVLGYLPGMAFALWSVLRGEAPRPVTA